MWLAAASKAFGVTLGRGSRVDALEKATKHLAFFGGHVALPAADGPRSECSDACGQSKASVRLFRAPNALFPHEANKRVFLLHHDDATSRVFTRAC
jgi:hypothetical protein